MPAPSLFTSLPPSLPLSLSAFLSVYLLCLSHIEKRADTSAPYAAAGDRAGLHPWSDLAKSVCD